MLTFKSISRLVALPHSIFALPFALASLVISWQRGSLVESNRPLALTIFIVSLAVIFARTAAMAFNRIVDVRIDSLNPRTSQREIPAGIISPNFAWGLVVVSAVGFLLSSYVLGWHCFVLSPIVLLILLAYSFTKRFTSYAHLVLGLSLALAPGGAWWVFRPVIEITPLLLMFAVVFWVAGFDILYSCQDVLFDREHGIYSIPARLGLETSLIVARFFHVLCFSLLILTGLSAGLPLYYYIGLLFLGIFLLGQHFFINVDDLSKINQTFFVFNGLVSVCYLFLVCLSIL